MTVFEMYEFIYINSKGFLTPYFRKILLFYFLSFLWEHCRGKDQGFNEKLNLGEIIFLANRERDEKAGSFRVLYFKQRELTSPIPALAPVL